MSKTKTFVLVIVALVLGHAVYRRLPLHRATLPAGFARAESKACVSIAAQISGRMDTRERCPHPHSPLPSFESEPDGFSGDLEADGKSYEVIESKRLPIAAFRTNTGPLLLREYYDCGHFWPRFQWAASNSSGVLQEVGAAEVAKRCGDVALSDASRNQALHMWTLRELYAHDPALACRTLIRFADADPHFAFQQSCRYPCGIGTEWPDLVMEGVVPHAAACPSLDALFAALRRMLDAGREDDFMQDVEFSMHAMYMIDQARGTAQVRDFIARTSPGSRTQTAEAFLLHMQSVKEKGYW